MTPKVPWQVISGIPGVNLFRGTNLTWFGLLPKRQVRWKFTTDQLLKVKRRLGRNVLHRNTGQMKVKRLKTHADDTHANTDASPMSGPGFFVHHKIAPFLHHTVTNRYPKGPISVCGEHVGVVNSLAWCPQPEHSHLLLSASHDRTVKNLERIL